MGCTYTNPQQVHQNELIINEDLQYQLGDKGYPEKKQNDPDNMLLEAEDQSGEQFMAVKPWIGALVPPTTVPKNDPSPPNKKLQLKFINGFKVEDSRQNIFWSERPDVIIYCAAAIGITMNINTLQQQFMGAGDVNIVKGHTDDIVSLGVSPDRKLVATGSLGSQPLILIWNAQNKQIKGRTKLGRNTRAVSTIRFSKNGKYFFCSDKHNDSNVYCYEVATMQLKGTEKCGSDVIFSAQTGKDNRYACATKSGVWFFQFDGQVMTKNRGIFGNSPRTPMASITYSDDNNSFLSGGMEGSIFYWNGNTCSKTQKIHQGAVMSICYAGSTIYSSGVDNLLKLSTYEGQVIRAYGLPSYAKSIDVLNNQIIVGTKCGRILKLQDQTKKQIMHGHWTGEAWGVALGNDGLIYSTADDNNILGFNPKTQKVEKQGIINTVPGPKGKIDRASTLSLLPPNQQSRAITISKSGHVALGINDGTLSIRTTKDLNTQIFKSNDAQAWIQVLKYNPNETLLAVGSHDSKIYIYNVQGNSYSLKGVLKGHSSYIQNMDWSKDGHSLQTVCGAYELLFWNVDKLSQITSGATQFRDEHWATYTIKIGWWVQGVFPPATMGTHVNGVDRTKDQKMIVTADNWGLVNLYRNPCFKNAKCTSYRAHSSHVVRAILNNDDTMIYSIGGYDKTMMVWKVTN